MLLFHKTFPYGTIHHLLSFLSLYSTGLCLSLLLLLLSNKDPSRTGRNTHTVPSRRTGTRRGVQKVNVTTSSMIKDLKRKKEESDKQDIFQEELSSMDGVLNKANGRLEKGGTLTISFLKDLIKSKGSEPPDGRKAALEVAWTKVKDDTDWARTVYFDDRDKKTLELLEDDNSDDEE